jgi:transcription termination factor Rho
MNLTELKKKPIGELIKIAEFMGLEGMARNRKQDIIFAILKRHAMNGEEIFVHSQVLLSVFPFSFFSFFFGTRVR